jgi:hypothetical protein
MIGLCICQYLYTRHNFDVTFSVNRILCDTECPAGYERHLLRLLRKPDGILVIPFHGHLARISITQLSSSSSPETNPYKVKVESNTNFILRNCSILELPEEIDDDNENANENTYSNVIHTDGEHSSEPQQGEKHTSAEEHSKTEKGKEKEKEMTSEDREQGGTSLSENTITHGFRSQNLLKQKGEEGCWLCCKACGAKILHPFDLQYHPSPGTSGQLRERIALADGIAYTTRTSSDWRAREGCMARINEDWGLAPKVKEIVCGNCNLHLGVEFAQTEEDATAHVAVASRYVFCFHLCIY